MGEANFYYFTCLNNSTPIKKMSGRSTRRKPAAEAVAEVPTKQKKMEKKEETQKAKENVVDPADENELPNAKAEKKDGKKVENGEKHLADKNEPPEAKETKKDVENAEEKEVSAPLGQNEGLPAFRIIHCTS